MLRGLSAIAVGVLSLAAAACGARTDVGFPGRGGATPDGGAPPLDAGSDAPRDVGPPVDGGTDARPLACDGAPLPRVSSSETFAAPPRAEGLGVVIPDPLGVILVGGLTGVDTLADEMAFLDLRARMVAFLPVLGPEVTLPASDAAAVYVPDGDFVVVVGGGDGGDALSDQVFSFTGEGDPSGLRRVRTGILPSFPEGPVSQVEAAYDPLSARVIVRAARGVGETGVGATWALAFGDAPTWTELVPREESPPPGGRGMGYDPERHRMIELAMEGADLGVYALSLEPGNERWQRLGTLGFSPSTTGELVWDPDACGFHILSARRTRCVLEHWVLAVGEDSVEAAYRGEVELEPAHFFGYSVFVPARNSLVLTGSWDCRRREPVPNRVGHELTLTR